MKKTIVQQSKKVKKSDLENLIQTYLYKYIYKQYKDVKPKDVKQYFSISIDSIYIKVSLIDDDTDNVRKFYTNYCFTDKSKLEKDFKNFSKKLSNISFGNLNATNLSFGAFHHSHRVSGKEVDFDSKIFIDSFEIACAYEIINN